MNSRISDSFSKTKKEGRAALVTYIMACDPDLDTSLKIMRGLPEAGADIIELGMPFSDPMADGPVIQKAAVRALASGANVKKVIAMVAEFRKSNQETPIILMGYYNPIYRYGVEEFVSNAKNAGVDGVIIVDLPPEEEGEFTDFSIPAELSLIKLTSPTTDEERAKVVLKNASGFVYYISVAGITGQKSADIKDIEKAVSDLRKNTGLPIVVGFGIKTPEQVAAVGKIADGVVVGSALVRIIEENFENRKKAVTDILDLVIKLIGK